jgi:hypothetical protein
MRVKFPDGTRKTSRAWCFCGATTEADDEVQQEFEEERTAAWKIRVRD